MKPPLKMGRRVVHEFPPTEPIVAMAICKDILFVATSRSVYQMVDGKLVQMEFIVRDLVECGEEPLDEEIPF